MFGKLVLEFRVMTQWYSHEKHPQRKGAFKIFHSKICDWSFLKVWGGGGGVGASPFVMKHWRLNSQLCFMPVTIFLLSV